MSIAIDMPGKSPQTGEVLCGRLAQAFASKTPMGMTIMARVVRIYENGGPSTLRIETVRIRPPGRGQVRLVQEAVGINFIDGMAREGTYPLALPSILGFEAAGTVEEVGKGVTGFSPGDRVCYFSATGAYATERIIDADRLIRLPDDISSETAATFLFKGITAWIGVRLLYAPYAGATVLVLGASGSVGSLLCRWAGALGATVIGVTGSMDKIARVKAGAAHALHAHDPQIVARIREISPRGVDAVYDFVGKETFSLATESIRDGGTIATIGANSGPPDVPDDSFMRRGVAIKRGLTPDFIRGDTLDFATLELWSAIRNGTFADLQTVRYPFGDIALAHTNIAERRLQGLPSLVP